MYELLEYSLAKQCALIYLFKFRQTDSRWHTKAIKTQYKTRQDKLTNFLTVFKFYKNHSLFS